MSTSRTNFTLSFGKNEMPGYHTGAGAHIGYLIGLRHSHLDNAGYSADQNGYSEKQPPPEELIEALLKEEQWRQILSSLVVCFFARGIYISEVVSELLHTAGFDIEPEEFNRIGQAIYREKYLFKTREGFSLNKLRIPKRIFETPHPGEGLKEEYMRNALRYLETIL